MRDAETEGEAEGEGRAVSVPLGLLEGEAVALRTPLMDAVLPLGVPVMENVAVPDSE